MNRLFTRAALSAFLAFGMASSAHAQWFAHASKPDVFGNQTVDAFSVATSGDGLVVQCNAKNTLQLAYIFSVTSNELNEMSNVGGLPVTLLLKVDNGAVMKLAAKLKPWNNTHGGFVVSGRSYPTVEAIKEIASATSNISVGVNFLGNEQSDNFGPANSTAAMNVAMQDCKLGDIKPPHSTAPATPGSGSVSD